MTWSVEVNWERGTGTPLRLIGLLALARGSVETRRAPLKRVEDEED